jgi:hypothetical protein
MLLVAFNAAETKCLEQINDVDILKQEDKDVTPRSQWRYQGVASATPGKIRNY